MGLSLSNVKMMDAFKQRILNINDYTGGILLCREMGFHDCCEDKRV
jgi:hypothetical protein